MPTSMSLSRRGVAADTPPFPRPPNVPEGSVRENRKKGESPPLACGSVAPRACVSPPAFGSLLS
jgi:hypothetical protein